MNTLLQLGILFQSLDSVQGRKKLQKMVHILQEFGVPFGMRFGYHHYGPFSEQLQDALHSFQHDGLIKETPVDGPFPTSRFTPNPKLWEFLTQANAPTKPAWTEFAQVLNGKTPRELEAISTLIYLEKQQSIGELHQEVDVAFNELKPTLVDLLPNVHTTLADYRANYPTQKLAA